MYFAETSVWESEFSYLINRMFKSNKATVTAVLKLLAWKKNILRKCLATWVCHFSKIFSILLKNKIKK